MTLVSESDTQIGQQLLQIINKKPGEAAAPAEPPPPAESAAPAESPSDDTEPLDASDDTEYTPDEGDEDASPVDPEPSVPSIDPPAGLTADETEVFRNSPPEVQKAWARREQERQREFRKWQNQQAEVSKHFAEHAKAIENERQILAAKMQEYGTSVESEFRQKFGNIKDPTELLNDPMKLLEYQAMQSKLAMFYQQRQAVQQQQDHERNTKFVAYRQAENEKLRTQLHLTDETAADFETKIVNFISKDLAADGWDEAKITAAIKEAPAVTLRMAHDAMKWRQAEARRRAAEKAGTAPPKVQRPGVKVDSSPAVERQKQTFNNLKKSGRVEDAAAFFKTII